MDQQLLAKNGISFNEDPVRVALLPAHIASLANTLLDFECTVSERLGLLNDEYIPFVENIYKRLEVPEFERSSISEALDHYKTIQTKAKRIHDGEFPGAQWQTFFFENFFNPLVKETRPKNEDSRR
jgi:hypothetical protein